MTAAGWTGPEGGSALPLRALLWLVLRLGPPLGQVVLWPLTAWYLATAGTARAASREFLGRVLGRPARLSAVARHFHAFAAVVLDRVFLIAGRTQGYDIRIQGLEHVHAVLGASRPGCVLLGAHLGSFEVLRSITGQAPAPVRPLMYRRNAGALTALLDRLAPGLRDAVIEIGEPDSMLRVKEAIERGEIVGMLADRAPGGARTVTVPFLGSPAAFPTGPFILAAALAAPVLLCHGVRTGRRRYMVRFQPFADRLVLPRTGRDAALRAEVGRYAAALEEACRAHPFNWFNFFPFWDDAQHTDPPGASPTPAGLADGARQPAGATRAG